MAVAHPNSFTLERLVAKDLPVAGATEVQGHVDGCPSCAGEIARIQADLAAFQAEVPYAAFRVAHEARKAKKDTRFFKLRWVAPVSALLAAGAAALLVVVSTPVHQAQDDGVRIKGGAVALSATVQEPGEPVRALNAGEILPEGARLSLSYDAGENTHVAVVGLDSAGQVTVYFPDNGERLAALPGASRGTLPFTLTLDGTPGPERFFAVFARGPSPVAEVRTAVQSLSGSDLKTHAVLPLPLDMAQSSIWVQRL